MCGVTVYEKKRVKMWCVGCVVFTDMKIKKKEKKEVPEMMFYKPNSSTD